MTTVQTDSPLLELDWLDEAPTGPDRPEWVDWMRGCPPRFATRRTWSRPTLGEGVEEAAKLLGWPSLMPWQRFVADVALEYELVDVGGSEAVRFFYRTVDGSVPRQSGKTSLGLPVKVHRCLTFPDAPGPTPWAGPQNVLYMAQSLKATRRKFTREQAPRIERSEDLEPLTTVRLANGDESIVWTNGSFFVIEAPTPSAGHGDTLHLVFKDEAWALKHAFAVEQSLTPTQITIPNAQSWCWSTQGDSTSQYFSAKCDAGRDAVRRGVTEGQAFFEWAAPPGSQLDDLEVWPTFHPAVGFTQTAETLRVVATDLAALGRVEDEDGRVFYGADEAKRAFFNWRQTARGFEPKIDPGLWAQRQRHDGMDVAPKSPIAVAIDVPPARDAAYIGVAWFVDDDETQVYTELDRVPISDVLEGPARVLEIIENPANEILRDKDGVMTVGINPVGAAGSLAGLLERMGMSLRKMTSSDMGRASVLYLDLLGAGRLTHGGQSELTQSAGVASTRSVGSGALWTWDAADYRQSFKESEGEDTDVSVSPLVASTVAVAMLVGLSDGNDGEEGEDFAIVI